MLGFSTLTYAGELYIMDAEPMGANCRSPFGLADRRRLTGRDSHDEILVAHGVEPAALQRLLRERSR